MKLLILLLFPIVCFSQPTGRWKTISVGKDSVQQSSDLVKWVNLNGLVSLNKDSAIMIIPEQTGWYRLKSGSYISKALYLEVKVVVPPPTPKDSVKVSGATMGATKLTWIQVSSYNMSYYSLYKNGVKVIGIIASGNKTYSYTIPKWTTRNKPKYTLIPVFHSGKASKTITFK